MIGGQNLIRLRLSVALDGVGKQVTFLGRSHEQSRDKFTRVPQADAARYVTNELGREYDDGDRDSEL